MAWYPNSDGQGNFGEQQVIASDADDAFAVTAADLDGDGDLDVLWGASSANTVAWQENTLGQGDFGPTQIITTDARGVESIYAADLDGDGDLDVLSASWKDGHIAWYQNNG